MKTVSEQLLETIESALPGLKYPKEVIDACNETELARIIHAWKAGNKAGWSCETDDPSGYLEKFYPKQFGSVKEKE